MAPRSSLPALLAARPAPPAISIDTEPGLRVGQQKVEADRQEQDSRPSKERRAAENVGDEINAGAHQGDDDVAAVARVLADASPAPDADSTARNESQRDHRPVERKKLRARKSGARHPHATAGRWRLDGLPMGAVGRLPDVSVTNGPSAGTPAFQRALAASRSARPTGAHPDSRALRRWSRMLRRAAAAAPDPRLQRELRSLARYAQELAETPSAKRADLATRRPQVLAEARALRSELPQRFGVDLLG